MCRKQRGDGEVKGKEEWKESESEKAQRGRGEVRRKRAIQEEQKEWGEKKRKKKNDSCRLLGNNLWSLTAANMADLALLVYHFGECSLLLSTYPSIPRHRFSTWIFHHHSPFYSHYIALSSFPPHASPHRILLLLVASLNFPSPPSLSSCPLSLHLTYFSVSSAFQHISALLGSTQRRATDGWLTERLAGWIWTCNVAVHLSLPIILTPPPLLKNTWLPIWPSWHHYTLHILNATFSFPSSFFVYAARSKLHHALARVFHPPLTPSSHIHLPANLPPSSMPPSFLLLLPSPSLLCM